MIRDALDMQFRFAGYPAVFNIRFQLRLQAVI